MSPGIDTRVHVVPNGAAREVVTLSEVIALIEAAFADDANGRHANFPVVRESLPYPTAGIFGIKAGLVRERRLLGLKAGGYWAQNAARGLPPHQSTVLLFDPDDGRPVALIGANDITGLRTGAAGAVAAKHLARPDSRTAALIGCGAQGRMQLLALTEVLDLERVRVWDANPDAARAIVAWAAERMDLPVVIAPDAEAAVAEADVIVTATPGAGPVLRAAWLRPGQHVSAIGADTAGKQELEADALRRATLVVDSLEQCRRLGETQHLRAEEAALGACVHAELGDVVAGRAPGRRRADEITIFDATGVTFQDLVVAGAIWRRCRERGLGHEVSL